MKWLALGALALLVLEACHNPEEPQASPCPPGEHLIPKGTLAGWLIEYHGNVPDSIALHTQKDICVKNK